MQSIKSHGFNQSEIQLLHKQVEIVNSRLSDDWEYLGEGVDADIVLSKEKVKLSDSSTLVLVGSDFNEVGIHTLDMPIRLMQLMTLLNERVCSSASNASAICKLMSEKEKPKLVLGCIQGPVMLDPENGVIRYCFESLSTLIKCLSETDNAIFIDKKNIDFGFPEQSSSSVSAKKVIWQLAKTEKKYSESHWADACKYKLTTWPRVREWDQSPFMLKLSMLFAKQYTSIEQASRVCSVDASQIKIFLHCCESVGIKVSQAALTGARQESALKPKQKTVVVGNKESLGWLHKKVREFLSYDH